MANISDVAKKAGVSVGTVSKVLNNDHTVKEKNRTNVLNAINELGYLPNVHAKNLSSGKTGLISIIIPTIGHEFQSRIVNSIDETLAKYEYDSVLFPLLSRDRLRRFSNPGYFLYQTDGIIVVSLALSSLFENGKIPTTKPYIMVDTSDDSGDSIKTDNYRGGMIAGEKIEFEKNNEMLIINSIENDNIFSSHVFNERVSGFRKGLSKRDIDKKKIKMKKLPLEFSFAFDLGLKTAENNESGFSVFAVSDILAWGFIEGCKKKGKIAGKDYRIIGYDDLKFSEKIGLSTVSQPIEKMGEIAAEKLIEKIKERTNQKISISLNPEYRERKTN